MTSLTFTKMQGLGNDFIVIDAREKPFDLSPEIISHLSDRHFGIGFDQLLLLENTEKNDADFSYRIFNADGGEVEQCGNGARCMARYIQQKNLSQKQTIVLATKNGLLKLLINTNNDITVSMGVPQFDPAKIPLNHEFNLFYETPFQKSALRFQALALGNPHAVLRVSDVTTADVATIANHITQTMLFPTGVNVGFMQIISREKIRLRVFERGAGETLACGSGACAAVVAGISSGDLAHTVLVELRGGNLQISWEGPAQEVLMTGPAEIVYEGSVNTPAI